MGTQSTSNRDIGSTQLQSILSTVHKKTELSNYIWQLKNAGKEWEIKWSVKGRAPIYTSGSKCCNLCIKEKTAICLHDPRTLLNSRTELLGKCSHKGDLELRYCLKPRHPKKKKPPQPP